MVEQEFEDYQVAIRSWLSSMPPRSLEQSWSRTNSVFEQAEVGFAVRVMESAQGRFMTRRALIGSMGSGLAGEVDELHEGLAQLVRAALRVLHLGQEEREGGDDNSAGDDVSTDSIEEDFPLQKRARMVHQRFVNAARSRSEGSDGGGGTNGAPICTVCGTDSGATLGGWRLQASLFAAAARGGGSAGGGGATGAPSSTVLLWGGGGVDLAVAFHFKGHSLQSCAFTACILNKHLH